MGNGSVIAELVTHESNRLYVDYFQIGSMGRYFFEPNLIEINELLAPPG